MSSSWVTMMTVIPRSRFELSQEIHDLAAAGRVEVPRRLVGQKDRRLRDDGAGDCDALLLSPESSPGEWVSHPVSPTVSRASRARARRSEAEAPR